MVGQVFKVNEVVRVLDAFLLKVRCPSCDEDSLLNFEDKSFRCSICAHSIEIFGFDLESSQRRNVVAWAKGNIRRFIGKKKVLQLFKMQEGLCAYCGNSIAEGKYHVDHIIPINFGGTNKVTNLALACPRCNLMAGAKVFPTFLAKKIYLMNELRKKQNG